MHYLVYNRTAGRGRLPNALDTVRDYFRDRAEPLTVLPAVQGTELTELLSSLPADARLLSLGGDGTLNGLLAATVHTGRTVGVLPAGSADDFASSLGLPRDDLRPALAAVLGGKTKLVDTGAVTLHTPDGESLNRHFVNALGTGFDAEVAAERETKLGWMKGEAGYYTALALSWFRLLRRQLTVHADGADQPAWSGRALLASCQNSPRTGGSFFFAPGAETDDGVMNLFVAGNVGHFTLLRLLPLVLQGRRVKHKEAVTITGRQFTLSWATARTLHLDGEIMPPVSRADITVEPASLRVFIH